MDRDPYSGTNETLILRDYLALDRTILANERTLLAYMRTALALVALGAAAIRFFQSPLLVGVGWTSAGFGIVTTFIGIWRYNRLRLRLARIVPPR